MVGSCALHPALQRGLDPASPEGIIDGDADDTLPCRSPERFRWRGEGRGSTGEDHVIATPLGRDADGTMSKLPAIRRWRTVMAALLSQNLATMFGSGTMVCPDETGVANESERPPAQRTPERLILDDNRASFLRLHAWTLLPPTFAAAR